MIPRNLMACLVLAIPFMLILSCGRSKSGKNTDDPLQPQYGGTLVYVKNNPPATLDPAKSTESESTIPCDNMYDGLVQLKLGTTGTAPGLARSWDISGDGLIYTFRLRQGVEFHDGAPFNADAVLFSFNRQRDPKHPYHGTGDDFEYWKALGMDQIIKDIRAADDSTVVFELQESNATFLYILSMQFTNIVSPAALKKWGSEFWKHPTGTGPFVLSEWAEDGTLTLTANEQYWDGRPYLDRLVFKTVPLEDDRVKQLIKGEIDMTECGSPDHIRELEKHASVSFFRQPGVNIGYLAMNMNKKYFRDLRVRKAVVYAIDREKLVSEVFGEFGRPAKNPIPPMLLGYNDEIRPTPYDPGVSKKLLAEAGYPDGFSCSLWALPIIREYMPDGNKAARMIQSDLAQVGIRTDIVTYPWNEYLNRLYAGEHDLALMGWIADIPDPDNFFFMLDKTVADQKQSNNVAFYRSDEMYRLIKQGKTVTSLIERSKIYKEACALFNTDLPWFVIAHSVVNIPMQKRVQNFQPYASYARRFNKVWMNADIK